MFSTNSFALYFQTRLLELVESSLEEMSFTILSEIVITDPKKGV